MRKSFLLMIISTFLFMACASTAMGQKENKSFSVGFGLEGGLPLGDIKDAYKFDGGLTIRLSYHVGPGFATLTTGALAFLPKSDLGDNTKATLQIPVKAGYKYVFSKPFFVMGEIGYSSFKVYSGSNGEIVSSNVGGFTYAPTVGVNFKAFEAGIRYEATSVSGGTFSDIGIRLGFNF